jgi:hypothetical protein
MSYSEECRAKERRMAIAEIKTPARLLVQKTEAEEQKKMV